MTISESTEVPFLSAMERKPTPAECEDVLKRWDLSIIKESVKRIWSAMHSRDDELTRGPTDYDAFADERRFYQRLLRERNSGGHGSVHGSRVLTILVALNTALLVGIGGWLLVTVSQHDKDIAVLKCQLDPQCREVLARGRP